MKIIGAGLSGLIAGAMFPGSLIFERQKELPNNHGAVLRFRTNKIARALNIPFKEVRVTKAIVYQGKWQWPDPKMQNYYSRKVTGEYTARSIASIDPVTRYIAPDNFIERLGEINEIYFGTSYPRGFDFKEPTISTIPMPALLDAVDAPYHIGQEFHRRSIYTAHLDFESADLYQTIYFPGEETPVYRASMTGSKMIVESIIGSDTDWNLDYVVEAFGLPCEWSHVDAGSFKHQHYGKIVEFDQSIRRSIIGQLTQDYNIYSLGRYATWRNILLDDVYEDIIAISGLIRMDPYTRRMHQ